MPTFYLNYLQEHFERAVDSALADSSRILDIGRGTVWGEDMVDSYGIDTPEESQVLTMDVRRDPEPHTVADLAELPFSDGSFSLIICESVLEHVAPTDKLNKCTREMYRVLENGGIVVGWVPYCYHYHGSGFADGNRFTHDGVERLFKSFETLEIQRCGGPVSVFLNALLQHRDQLIHRGTIERYETQVEYALLSRLIDDYNQRQPYAFNGVGFRFFGMK